MGTGRLTQTVITVDFAEQGLQREGWAIFTAEEMELSVRGLGVSSGLHSGKANQAAVLDN